MSEMIGPHHEHIAHMLSWFIEMRMGVADILQLPFYHPVIEEGMRSGMRNLLTEMGMGPPPPKDYPVRQQIDMSTYRHLKTRPYKFCRDQS